MSQDLSSSRDSFWQRAIVFCFHFLLLATPLVFTWFNDELFEFGKMLLTYAVTVIIGSLWISRMISEKRIFIRRTVFDIPIGLFLASQIISTVFSIDVHTSLFGYYTRFNGGLLSFLCYILLFYAFVSNVRKVHLPKLFLTTFVSAFLVSAMAIPEHFGHAFSCLTINLYRFRNQALPEGWFWQFYDTSCWIQDIKSRAFASFGQPNWLAAYAVLLIPIGMVLTVSEEFVRSKFIRIFYAVTTWFLFLSLLFTRSRSGVLGLAIGVVVFGIGFLLIWLKRFFNQDHHTTHFASKTWWNRFGFFSIAFILLILFSLATFGTPFTKNYGEAWITQQLYPAPPTVTPITPPASPDTSTVDRLEVGGTDSAEIRKIVWTGAIRVWQRYPIFGSGVETFAYSYYKDRPIEHNYVSEWDFLYNKAHNEFLNFLATTGLVGLFTYSILVSYLTFYAIWFLIKKHNLLSLSQHSDAASNERTLLCFAMAGGLVALSISNFLGFSTVMVNILLFLLPAFLVVLYFPDQIKTWNFAEIEEGEQTKKTPVDSGEEDDAARLLSIVSYVIIFCICLGLLFSIYSMWRADFLYTRGKQYLQINKASESIRDLRSAVQIAPNEVTFQDSLAATYSRIAAAFAEQGDATSAAQVAIEAINTSDKMLSLSPANLNLYKTQARVYMNLAQLEPKLLTKAKTTLEKAIDLSPTDPKLRYFLALVEMSMGDTDQGLSDLEKTVEMKPNYQAARLSLAEQYRQLGKKEEAKQQYEYILQKIQPDDEGVKSLLASLSAEMKAPSSK